MTQNSFNKYLKYKKKYLNLKNLKGAYFDFNKEEEKQFLTNNLEISDLNPYYFQQNLFSYWISSSHNTYLPFGQIFDPSSVCYYKLQSLYPDSLHRDASFPASVICTSVSSALIASTLSLAGLNPFAAASEYHT